PAGLRARVPLPDRFVVGEAIRPLGFALLVAILAVPTAVRDLVATQIVVYSATTLLLPWAVIALARRALGARTLPTIPGLACIAAIHGAVVAFGLPVVTLLGIPTPRALAITGGIAGAGVGTAIAIALLVEARRAASEAELAAVVERMEVSTVLLRRRVRLARRRLARLLHGSLQGELYAAALRLRETSEPPAADMDEVRAAIAAAIRRLDDPPPDGGRTRATLDALAGTWAGLRTIDVSLADGVATRLAADPDADEAVAEVIREAANNALRHGGAARVAIAVGFATLPVPAGDAPPPVPAAAGETTLLVIRVADDGAGWPADAPTGQGTATFDDLSLRWEHASDVAGTVVIAQIPIRATTSPSALP
ncbi:MAG: hypothetical protein ACKOTZ_09070, partial [Chloroflexota bacterium]